MNFDNPDPQAILASRFMQAPSIPPLHVVRAEGCELILAGGMRLLDASGGPMVVNVGHGRPEITQAIREASDAPGYVMPFFSSPSRLRLIEGLRDFLPDSHGRIFLTSGGSEALESAFKVARAHHVARGETGRDVIIDRQLAYHGSTWATLAAGDAGPFRQLLGSSLPPWPKLPLPRAHWTPLGPPRDEARDAPAQALQTILDEVGPHRVAAIVFEPIGAAMSSVLIPPPGYYESLARLCREHGILMIADEVVTGFGRTGKAFGYQHWDFVPDIIAFAKGVSGGYAPLGGIAVEASIVAALEDAGVDPQNRFTFSGHPLACAAGAAVLKILREEKLVDRVRTNEARLRSLLSPLREHPLVRDVRGVGHLWSVSLGRGGRHFDAALGVKNRLLMQLFMRGLLAWPGYGCDANGDGDAIIIAPPFVADEAVLERIASGLREALDGLGAQDLMAA